MKKNNKILTLSIFLISVVFFIGSFIYLYQKSNVKVKISDKELSQMVIDTDKEIDKLKLNLKELPQEEKQKQGDITIKKIFDIGKVHSKVMKSECKDKELTKEQQINCYKKFYFHKYAQFLDYKGIVDLSLCNNIKKHFGEDSYLFNRCQYTYAVNSGTKYLNVKECDILSKDLDPENKFTRKACIDNVIYGVFGKDNTLGKYFQKIRERGDGEKSPLYSQLLNKNAKIINGIVGGTEFYKFDIDNFLKTEYQKYKETQK